MAAAAHQVQAPAWAYDSVQRRGYAPDDPLFLTGDADRLRGYEAGCGDSQRQSPSVEQAKWRSEFVCTVQGCHEVFSTTAAYEAHFRSVHLHRCQQCRKVLPSDRLLQIHVAEVHDALFAVLAEKQPMFECLVPGCGVVCASRRHRKNHLVEDHSYASTIRVGQLIGGPRPKAPRHPRVQARGGVGEGRKGCEFAGGGAMELDIARTPPQRAVPTAISFGRRGRASGRRGRYRSDEGGRGTQRVCFHCQQPGHLKRDCPNSARVGAME